MSFAASIAAFALLLTGQAPSAPIAQDGAPELSEDGWCVAHYNAFGRARDRRAKSPKRLHETAGFFSIDFAKRAAAVRAKLAKNEDFAITFHQQAIEEGFDLAGYADADGKPQDPEVSQMITAAVIEVRNCDTSHGFNPPLLQSVATLPAPTVEPYGCAVNYFALGMGMKSDPNAQRAAMQRISASMMRLDNAVAEDSVWRDILRARIQADAAERNKAVGAGTVKPQDLFAYSQACDRLLATPA